MVAAERMELVSVIVPAYNAAATIGETLESALAQTYPGLEVIVVDDGSSDATGEIVSAFAARDPRVRLLRQANAGVAAARNLAIAHARGAYVAPLDADDLWHPEKLALQVAAMRRGGPRVGVVYCWWRVIDMEGRVIGESRSPSYEGDVHAAVIIGEIPGKGSVPLLRRAYLVEVGGYDPDLRVCEDLKLYLQLAERYDFTLVPQYLVGYRRTPGSLASDPRRIFRAQTLVLAEARRRHPELPARLFRVAEARCRYQQAKNCLSNGLLSPGLAMFLRALWLDSAGAAYRMAEELHRVWLRWAPKHLDHWPRLRLSARAVQPDPSSRLTGGSVEAQTRDASAAAKPPADIRGQPFLTLPAEPTSGARFGNSLYSRYCSRFAASLAVQSRRAVTYRGIPSRAGDPTTLGAMAMPPEQTRVDQGSAEKRNHLR